MSVWKERQPGLAEPECQPISGALVEAMRVIAAGYWNVGRKPDAYLTVNEYAREALRAAGLDDGATP